jgi:hypothetical protein
MFNFSWGFNFKLKLIFGITPAASKNDAHKSGQN